MPDRPSGTVTFLFTDIEGSTRRWEQHPAAMQVAHSLQEEIIRRAVAHYDGFAYKMIGDAFQVAFASAVQAINAALVAQRDLFVATWPREIGELRVRMALHTGVTEERGDDYVGPLLNRVARLMSAGHGGQILLTEATAELVRALLPADASLVDMGEHQLKDLLVAERVFQIMATGLPADFPPLLTLNRYPTNLPTQPTPIIGRKKEVVAVRALLSRPTVRLLTLIGPGGIGKTRLAIAAASGLRSDFPDGVFFVNLAPLAESRLVLPSIAYTLGLREAGSRSLAETLKEQLSDKQMLVLLDNFEHLMDAAGAVADLLKAAPQLALVVTSRAPLHLSLEQEYPVPALVVPEPGRLPSIAELSQYEAVALFIQRAATIKPDFALNDENAAAVADICYRLEGIPLAIELAASRVKTLPPAALLARLGSRLKLLTGGSRDLDARQQTLRNAIGWSYDLLTTGEKQLFRRMAVFRGGRMLDATAAVCNAAADNRPGALPALELEVLDGLTSLVDKSLMYVTEGVEGEPRYWMLETIHEYAWEQLGQSGEAAALQRQHALFFMALAEEAEPQLLSGQQAAWLIRLEEEHDNIRVALLWARTAGPNAAADDAAIGLRIAGAMWRFWYIRGYFAEGREQLAAALAAAAVPGQPTRQAYQAKALNGAGGLAWSQGDYATARALHEQSLALRRELGDRAGIANSLYNLGTVADAQGDCNAARALYQQSLVLRQELGDKWGVANSLNNLGGIAQDQGDYSTARALHEQSLALRRELGDKRGIASSLINLGGMVQEQRDYATARMLLEESLLLCRELGDKRGMASSLNNLGTMAYAQDEYDAARALHEQSLALRRELGDKQGIAASLAGLGAVAVSTGRVQAGSTLLGAVEALLVAISAVLAADDRIAYERGRDTARTQQGDAEFRSAWAAGRSMSMEQAIEYALALAANQP